MEKIDDSKLLSLLADPKTRREAFGMVVAQYSEQMYWKIRRIVLTHEDADDVLQNAFMKAWKNIESFRKDSRLSTWLYRIAINEALDMVRHKNVLTIVSTDDTSPGKKKENAKASSIAETLRADDYFDGNEAQTMLQEAIAQLPEVQRNVFNMRYFDDMKYSEMSQILNTSEGALKASYHIAVKKITQYFHRHD